LDRTRSTDVVVAGGGAAGVAAAIGAARAGASVVLVERAAYLGGAATHSNVLTYCGFWTQSDPAVQVVRGVGEEVLREIAALGGDVAPQRTASNVVVALLDPEIVKFALDRVCERAGLEPLLHATLTGATPAGERITSVAIDDRGGTSTVAARAFVDASGDADLAARSGAAVRYGSPDGSVQNGTLVVRFGGIAAGADTSRGAWERAIRAGKGRGLDALTKEHGLVVRIPGSNDVVAYLADEDYDVRDARSHAAAERHGRRQAWQLLEAVRALPGHAAAYIVTTGPAIGTRESRHVVSRRPLVVDEVVGGARFADAVAVGGWPVEHHPGAGRPNRWIRIAGDGAYEIPLGALQSVSYANLFAAGRTLDADRHAFASLRVMGTAFATGQAAGVAAAQYARNGETDAERVRVELIRQGALIAAPHLERNPA
jgi:NADPH-dependent 2,4-dienoyl-CoA reductase/sulfur reductase-like enzyme